MSKLIALMLCFHLCAAGCAIRGSRATRNRRGELLATEKGKLIELTDPVARTKSFIVIADILVSYVADAARDQDHDALRGLLVEYGRTIGMARDTIVNSERRRDRRPQGFSDLETALRRHVRTLQSLKPKLNSADQGLLDQAVQIASSIHQELANMLSRPGAGN